MIAGERTYTIQMIGKALPYDEDVTISPALCPRTHPFNSCNSTELDTLSILAYVALTFNPLKDVYAARSIRAGMEENKPGSTALDRPPKRRRPNATNGFTHQSESDLNHWHQRRKGDESTMDCENEEPSDLSSVPTSSPIKSQAVHTTKSQQVQTGPRVAGDTQRLNPRSLLPRKRPLEFPACSALAKSSSEVPSATMYACSYCGRLKASTSTGQDGRIRIRCECGGKHRDGSERMHAM